MSSQDPATEVSGFHLPSKRPFRSLQFRDRFVESQPPLLIAELTHRRAAVDCQFFLEGFWQVRTATGGIVPFDMFDCQKRALFQMLKPQAHVLILKSRQLGFTTLVAGLAAWLAMTNKEFNVAIASRTKEDSDRVLLKIRQDGYPNIPEWLRDRFPHPTNKASGKIDWSNGSWIEAFPAGNAAARGTTASVLILDEWAWFANPEEALSSARPTTSTGGSLIVMSTARAAGTLYHKQWRDAVRTVERRRAHVGATKSKFFPMFFGWYEHPDRDDDWFVDNVLGGDYTPAVRAREWPSNPEQAFTEAGSSVFGRVDRGVHVPLDADRKVPQLGSESSVYVVDEVFNTESLRGVSVWRDPVKDHRYVIGADVGTGAAGGDFSSAHVVDIENGDVVAHYHARVGTDIYADALHAVGLWYNQALLCVERNAIGLAVVMLLRKQLYPNLFYEYPLGERIEYASEKIGFHTTTRNKGMIIAQLEAALRNADIVVHCDQTLAELDNFTLDENTGKYGRQGVYDDRVISLALSNFLIPYAIHTPEYRPAPRKRTPEKFTGEWLLGDPEPDSSLRKGPAMGFLSRRQPVSGIIR